MAISDCFQLWRPTSTRVKLSLVLLSQNKGPLFARCAREEEDTRSGVSTWADLGWDGSAFAHCWSLFRIVLFSRCACCDWDQVGFTFAAMSHLLALLLVTSSLLLFVAAQGWGRTFVCAITWVANQWQWHVTCRLAAAFTIWSKKQQRNNGMGSSLRTMLTATWMCVVQDRLPSQ